MSIKGNIIKGWITSIIGTVAMLTSIILSSTGAISFWTSTDKSGAIMLIAGTILLLTPRSIEILIGDFIKDKGREMFNKDDEGPWRGSGNVGSDDKG